MGMCLAEAMGGTPCTTECRDRRDCSFNLKPWNNGQPYYCKTCGAGGGERMACEEPDCELETAEEARRRIDSRQA